MITNIPKTELKRVVIIGGGFGGLKLARKLTKEFQVILIDKQNYHQFQPLLYQVATAGLESSSIAFPFRKAFQKKKNIYIRIAEATSVNILENSVITNIGAINYDFLVFAQGVTTNYFGNKSIIANALPMKSIEEALQIRNKILENYESALTTENKVERKALMNIVIVGGGPTGVEISGTLAQMKNSSLPKDYPELDFSLMEISLIELSPRLLSNMSDIASRKAQKYLEKLGVKIYLNANVKDYNGTDLILPGGITINARTVIWAAGVIGHKFAGIPETAFTGNNRIKVNRYNKVEGTENIFAIGDIACMLEENYPKGHPQLAQPAIQQAENLAKNLKQLIHNKTLKEFHYKNLGTMATIGRNLAVADLPIIKLQGFFAWVIWVFVHLLSIVGVKNRLFILINWIWSYITHDQSLRLIVRPIASKEDSSG
jgi:NADH dehydrogenase